MRIFVLTVEFCICLCINDSVGNHFNTNNSIYSLGHRDTNCSGTAAQVQKSGLFACIDVAPFSTLLVKKFGCSSVDLEESAARYPEAAEKVSSVNYIVVKKKIITLELTGIRAILHTRIHHPRALLFGPCLLLHSSRRSILAKGEW